MYKQHPPYTIQIELTEGCNRGCNFCGLQGMRKTGTSPWYYMTKEVAQKIATEIEKNGWNSRIIFAMHGEPTLNPSWVSIIAMFRKHLPKSVFSIMTNGFGIANSNRHTIGEYINKIESIGVNDLIIDTYAENDDGNRIKDYCNENNINYTIYGRGVPLYSGSHKGFRILFTLPIQENKGTTINRKLCNHCGAAFPLDFSCSGKRCTRPFRELSFRYDGSVAICCNDFRGQYPIGNILEQGIDEIWQSKKFQVARILLYAGERDSFKPCRGCNATSVRVGLLPDPLGKEDLPKPTDKERLFAESVSKLNKPLCGNNFVKRPWEDE